MGVGQSLEPLNTAAVRPKWVQILNNLKVLLTLQTKKHLLQWTKVLLSSRLNEYSVICLAIFSCIHLPIHPPTHPSIHPSNYAFQPIRLSFHSPVYPHIYFHNKLCPFTYLPPSNHLSSPQPICSSICSVIHISFHSPVYLVIQQCIYFTRC